MKERQPISFTIIHDLPNVRGLSFDDALNVQSIADGGTTENQNY